MDQGNGTFKEFPDAQLLAKHFAEHFLTPEAKKEAIERVFAVGEEVAVKGSRFRVTRITPKKLILRLLPDKGDK